MSPNSSISSIKIFLLLNFLFCIVWAKHHHHKHSSSSSCSSSESSSSSSGESGESDEELVLLQSVWRHGDRTPAGTFPKDIYQQDFWYQGWGSLTPLGMEQQFVLGKKLRHRYVDQLGFMDGKFHMDQIYVRSTDYNRTLMSAISNMIGFFGPGTPGKDTPEKLPGWPGHFVPVPVHTMPLANDFVGGTIDPPSCARRDAVMAVLTQSPEVKNATAVNAPFLAWLSNMTGASFTNMFSLGNIFNAFFIEKDVNGLPLVDFVEHNKTVRPNIARINNQAIRWNYGMDVKTINGINFRVELAKMNGGPLLWQMIGNMQAKVECMNSNATSSQCTWINPMKYFVYSAHDSALMGLFAALGFKKTNYDTDGYPLNSACATVELWRNKNSKEFSVKIQYWKPEMQRKPSEPLALEITKDVEGCSGLDENGGCNYVRFVNRSLPYKPLPSAAEYCSLALNSTAV